jgi:hypothetical protein
MGFGISAFYRQSDHPHILRCRSKPLLAFFELALVQLPRFLICLSWTRAPLSIGPALSRGGRARRHSGARGVALEVRLPEHALECAPLARPGRERRP